MLLVIEASGIKLLGISELQNLDMFPIQSYTCVEPYRTSHQLSVLWHLSAGKIEVIKEQAA